MDRSTGRGINGRGPFERQVSSPTALRRTLDDDLAYQFIVLKQRRIGIADETGEWERALTPWAQAADFCLLRKKNGGPVSAGIRFRQGAADGATIADLCVRNSRGAVMKNRHPRSYAGFLNLSMSREGPKAHRRFFFFDIGRRRE